MAVDGTFTIRLNETRDVTASIKTSLSNVITAISGTVKITDANNVVILDTTAVSGTVIVSPSYATCYFTTNPFSKGMVVDTTYNYLFKMTVTISGRVYAPECFMQVTVIGDTE